MIRIEKLRSGFIMFEKKDVSRIMTERAISTIPELRQAIGGWAVSKINTGKSAKYIIEIKEVK